MTPNQPLEEIKLYTVKEVSVMLHISRMTIYRLIDEGELPAIRVGRSIRVGERALREYLQNAAVEPTG